MGNLLFPATRPGVVTLLYFFVRPACHPVFGKFCMLSIKGNLRIINSKTRAHLPCKFVQRAPFSQLHTLDAPPWTSKNHNGESLLAPLV